MIVITEKLYYRKIVLISLLKSKGIYNPTLFTKIINSNKRQLNLIHAKQIKHTRINDKSFFKHIIKDRYFRLKTSIDDKKDILGIELNKILKSRYYNNKSNVIFQEFIQYILELLTNPKVHYNNTHLFRDLVQWVNDNYTVKREVNIIHEMRRAGKYTLDKLKLISEFIDHIDYYNYLLNDITRIEKLRSFKSTNIDAHIINQFILIENYIKHDKLLKQIYAKLTLDKGRIQTKLLYNELVNLKEQLRQKMHSINYGIETNNKVETLGDRFNTQVMPFTESGRVDISDKQFINLNINTMYFKKSDTRSIKNFKNGYYNKRKIDGQINIIFEGINPFNKGNYSKSYMIQYQYKSTIQQQKQFKQMMQSLKTSIINNRQYNQITDLKDYVYCTYNYPFLNQTKNYNAFKEYYQQLNVDVKFRDIYPYIARSTRQKNKFINFTSFNNNIWRDNIIRKTIDRNLANILYRIDFERLISDFYNPKNQLNLTKRKQRVFLSNIIKQIISSENLTKLFNQYLNDLIKGYSERIYLFQLYGIDALKNQTIQLQQYYNTNLKYKWNNKARQINKVLRSLGRQIKQRKIYLEYLIMQKFTIDKFSKEFKPRNILVQSLIHENIVKYLSKSLIRKITTQRTKLECIQMCCNNLNSIKVKYMDNKPIYVKEINDDYSKFDELLGTSETFKVQYIDKETSIDIIALFKCIIKFDRYLDLNDLYDKILNFKITDKNKLKSYLYKEKVILNQI